MQVPRAADAARETRFQSFGESKPQQALARGAVGLTHVHVQVRRLLKRGSPRLSTRRAASRARLGCLPFTSPVPYVSYDTSLLRGCPSPELEA